MVTNKKSKLYGSDEMLSRGVQHDSSMQSLKSVPFIFNGDADTTDPV